MTKLLLSFALLVVAAPALAGPHYPPLQGKPVVDAANIIPDDVETALNTQLFNYEHSTKHQLMVATVPSLDGQDIETYATGYFRSVGLGGKDKDDGILFVIAPNEHKVRIETGYGTQSLLTDAQSGIILHEHVTPFFKQGDFAGGIQNGVNEIVAETTPKSPAQLALEQREKQRRQERADRTWAAIKDFFLTALGIWAAGGVGYGLYYHFVTGPERRRVREEQERRDAEETRRRAAEEAEQERREQEILRRQQEERERKLARMSPEHRAAFLAKEEAQRQAAAERAYAAEQERLAAEERRRERDRQAAEEEERAASNYNYSSDDDGDSSSSSFGSDDDDDSFSGGGGSSGGGGASDGW